MEIFEKLRKFRAEVGFEGEQAEIGAILARLNKLGIQECNFNEFLVLHRVLKTQLTELVESGWWMLATENARRAMRSLLDVVSRDGVPAQALVEYIQNPAFQRDALGGWKQWLL